MTTSSSKTGVVSLIVVVRIRDAFYVVKSNDITRSASTKFSLRVPTRDVLTSEEVSYVFAVRVPGDGEDHVSKALWSILHSVADCAKTEYMLCSNLIGIGVDSLLDSSDALGITEKAIRIAGSTKHSKPPLEFLRYITDQTNGLVAFVSASTKVQYASHAYISRINFNQG